MARIFFLLGAVCLLWVAEAGAATILLKTGEIAPGQTKAQAADVSGYVLLQLDRIPESRAAYEAVGIQLLRYVPERAWWAYVSPGANGLAGLVAQGVVTYVAPASEIDKIEPVLRGKRGGMVDLHLLFLPGVSREEAEAALRTVVPGPVTWDLDALARVQVPAGAVAALNTVPGVEWVSPVPPPDKTTNVTSAQRIKVDVLQAPPLELDGTGITFGLWEAEGIPFPHLDIAASVFAVDDEADYSAHATHVAGTLLGSGANDPFAKGMATGATIRAYDASGDVPEMLASAGAGLVQLSNHSYGTRIGWDYDEDLGQWVDLGTELFGAYSAFSYVWDNAVRQTELAVFKSAGNDRGDGPSGEDTDGPFDTMEHRAGAKNVIAMGALTDSDAISSFSNWGPMDDGRVKPDLCANGVGLYSPVPDIESQPGMPQYAFFSGTSMSSPSGCGAGALIYQRYREVQLADPTAATLKALLIHGARDLGRPGPDYEFGWGIIDAEKSEGYVSNSLFREGVINTGGAIRYQVEIPEGAGALRATLVWSDPPGSPSSSRALVNDLDLRLLDPEGNPFLAFVLDGDNPANDATTGRNEVDNVEQVVVELPVAGTWEIEVAGFAVPEGPNAYSVVSEGFGDFLGIEGEGGALPEGEGEATQEGEGEAVAEGEGETGCATVPTVVDFCTAFNNVRSSNLMAQLDEEFQPLVDQLDPATADINGIYFVDISNLEQPVIEVEGNGLLDAANELALIQAILADKCFDNGRLTHKQVFRAWDHNKKRLLTNQVGPLAPLLVNLVKGIDTILVGYLTIGGGQIFTASNNSASGEGSFGIVAGLFQVINDQLAAQLGSGFTDPTLEAADFRFVAALQLTGDADGDGYTNQQEYDHYVARACPVTKGVTLPDYPTAALDPTIFPGSEVLEGEGSVEGEGIAEGSIDGEGSPEGIAEGEGTVDGEGSTEGEGEGSAQSYHAADTDTDHEISLAELLRPIQFYNADGFSCAGTEGEDPYLPTPGDCSACAAYSGDYEAPTCKISLSELLRLIQFFNLGSYAACEAADGFCPGAV